MKSLWYPLSALFLDDPPAYASAFVLERMLAAGGEILAVTGSADAVLFSLCA
ncbi:MAG: hypothetical protein JSV80_11755 [Acidobacteriota bacterium]|nr:MAG: hypothetical protein JSV80_11755 [Acidobacteriota bacterium]